MTKYGYPEIGRFEIDQLLYQVCLYNDGELRFWVTGDNIRLGLLTQEDLYWDCSYDLPAIGSTDQVVNIHWHSLCVMRRVARLYAQYLLKYLPSYLYYNLPKDPRVERIVLRLVDKVAQLSDRYDITRDDDNARLLFTRNSMESTWP